MATKANESFLIGKEKKASSSNSHITTTLKRSTTKPSITKTIKSTTKKPNSTPLEKPKPNHLKPTKPSSLDSSTKKPSLAIKRESLEKPLPSSNLTRSLTPRGSSSIANKITIPSKPISERVPTKVSNDGKTKPLVTKVAKKVTPNFFPSTSFKNKVANKDHASVKPTTRTKKTPKETTRISRVEGEQVKEVTSQEVEVVKVENEEYRVHKVGHVTDVEYEHGIEHVKGVEHFGPPHYQVDDERVISTVSDAEEESAKDEEHEVEEEKTNQGKGGNNNESDHGEVVVNHEGEGSVTIIEDQKSENKNNIEKEAIEKKKKAVEKVKENKVEATTSSSNKQQLGERRFGKMEALVSNDEIEKTASKLLEERKNKVRALAGAFQTVIDNQATSK